MLSKRFFMKHVITSSAKRRPKPNRFVVTVILLVVCVIGICVFMLPHNRHNPVENQNPPIVETPRGKAEIIPTTLQTTQQDESLDADKDSKSKPMSKDNQNGSSEQNDFTNVALKVVTGIESRKIQKPTGFNGGAVEQIACMMLSVSDEVGMPPTPLASEEKLRENFFRAITNNIVVYEDDDERVVALKENVADMKNQLADILEANGSLTASLKEYERWVNENKEIRDGVLLHYHKLLTETSAEEAQSYLDAANAELKAEGITPITLNFRDRVKLRKLSRTRESAGNSSDERTQQGQ
jgi:hypothetical protein